MQKVHQWFHKRGQKTGRIWVILGDMDMGLSCYFPFVGTKSFVRFTRIMVYNGRLITTVWGTVDFLRIF